MTYKDTQIGNIPGEIKDRNRWMGMKLVPDKKRPGRFKKLPIDCKTNKVGSSTDPEKWSSFSQAIDALKRYGLNGIGFALGEGIFGVDIDHCIHDGVILPEAQDIIDFFDSYTETSFSGDGVHILALGKKPAGFDQCKAVNFNGKGSDLEIYDSGRYFVVTGEGFMIRPIRQIPDELLTSFAQKHFAPQQITVKKNQLPSVKITEPFEVPEARELYPVVANGLSDNDEQVVIRCQAKRNGQEFNDQMSGGNPAKNGDLSGNDLSLCNKLATETRDADQIDRIFRSSNRFDFERAKKWDTVHFRQTGETYGQHTVRMAIEGAVSRIMNRAEKQPSASDYSDDKKINFYEVSQMSFIDLDNAKRFSDWCSGILIYTSGRGWLWWNDKVWNHGEHYAYIEAEKHVDALRKFAARVSLAANSKEDQDTAEDFQKKVWQLRSKARIDAMIKLAANMLHIEDDMLDQDGLLLNTPDGAIDLRTGDVRPARPEDYFTKITACGIYPDESGVSIWEEFLDQLTDGNIEYQNYLQYLGGQCVTGRVFTESLYLALGGGGNGKSTFFNPQLMAVGSYGMKIDPEVLLATNKNIDPALAELKGARFVLSSETDEGQRMSSAQLKKIASTDHITGRRLYHAPESFTPSHTFILYTNHAPKVSSTDNGTWRRIVALPFRHKWDKNDPNRIEGFGDYLFENAGSTILSWMIAGAKMFLQAGGKMPGCLLLESETENYRRSEDWLSNFLNENCEVGPEYRVSAQDLYLRYRTWASDNGDYARRQRDFSDAMTDKQFVKIHPKNRSIYLGLRLQYNDAGSAFNRNCAN